jgi:hypothetical protein
MDLPRKRICNEPKELHILSTRHRRDSHQNGASVGAESVRGAMLFAGLAVACGALYWVRPTVESRVISFGCTSKCFPFPLR